MSVHGSASNSTTDFRTAGSVVSVVSCLLLNSVAAHAQVVTDGSLGTPTSIAGPNFVIDQSLGQARGTNLFHSFSSFDVGANQSATFASTAAIANIIARVTGPGASRIDGALNANANLFLLNPQGVMFGAGATLNVIGSFHVSTADYVRFADGGRFMASLGPASVLSIAPPAAFGFLGSPRGALSVQGATLVGATGRDLSFIGGDVTFDQARISLQQGRINLAALGSAGEVTLSAGGLDVSSFTELRTLRMQQTLINALDEPGSSIYIRGGELVVKDNSLLVATSVSRSDAPQNIDISVDRVQLQGSGIVSSALLSGTGASIELRARAITLSQGASVIAASDSSGIGGDVNVQADVVTIGSGVSTLGTGSVLGTASVGGTGGAGDLTIRADSINVTGGSLSTITAAQGAAGNITLIADRVSLQEGAIVTSATSASGDGGSVSITARELMLEGSGNSRPVINAASSAVRDAGDAGDIAIDVDTLQLRNGRISSSTAGPGRGGTITIEARGASLENGASITSESRGVDLSGSGQAHGAGGSIVIHADSLQMLSGADISVSTLAEGAGGAVIISAGRLLMEGSDTSVTATTGSIQNVATSGAGGQIAIEADSVEVRQGATINTSTYGRGAAGRVELVAGEILVTSGASISASSLGQGDDAGDGSDVYIDADRLTVAGGAQISNATFGAGAAGHLLIEAEELRLESGALLQASSLSAADNAGAVGDLFIDAGRIVMDAASIQARSAGAASPGSIAIRSNSLEMNHSASIVALSTAGDAGDIGIYAATGIHMRGLAQIATDAQGGSGGNLALVTDGALRMHQSSASTSVLGGSADGGNIFLDGALMLLDDSSIAARAVSGDGGRIDIGADFLLRSAGSAIDASSDLGIDGAIGILGFDVDLNADIASLPADFLDAHRWLALPCARRQGMDVSQLTIAPRDGAFRSPGDLISSPLDFAESGEKIGVTFAATSASVDASAMSPACR